jgi:hypothetical protein
MFLVHSSPYKPVNKYAKKKKAGLTHHLVVVHIYELYYTPHYKVVGGILDSACPSVRLSVFRFPDIFMPPPWSGQGFDWLIAYFGFYIPLKNFSLIWRRHHCRWRAANFRPMLGARGLWAGRDLYHATPAVTRDLSFSGLIRRTAPFSRLLRHTRGY